MDQPHLLCPQLLGNCSQRRHGQPPAVALPSLLLRHPNDGALLDFLVHLPRYVLRILLRRLI